MASTADSRQNPLDIPELLYHLIGFVHDVTHDTWSIKARRDILSCSLVARSWAAIAQSYLFCEPHLTCDNIEEIYKFRNTQSKFCDALLGSPHLTRYVRSLLMVLHPDFEAVNEKLGSIRFSNLDEISLKVPSNTPKNWATFPMAQLQGIVGLATLRRLYVKIEQKERWLAVAPLFPHFSSSIRHLYLDCDNWGRAKDSVTQSLVDRRPRIHLESLYLAMSDAAQNMHPNVIYPFDIAQLRSLRTYQLDIDWDSLPQETKLALRKIDLCVMTDKGPDLSFCKNLENLRLHVNDPRKITGAVATLKSLGASQHLRCIAIDAEKHFGEDDWKKFNSVFCSIASHPIVELVGGAELPLSTQEILGRCFPALESEGRLRMVPHYEPRYL
ncbi:hypothetical protein R3P38DRAFT_1116461 [Favolaschia claudopus]|uniref:F-box domain-containing protein n=1 Tax=Favolaschia claudopus TaxID=2862362 RepID=A0AAW0B817_9AGAR